MGCNSSRQVEHDGSPPARATNTTGLGTGAGNASSSSQAIVNQAGSISNAGAPTPSVPATAHTTASAASTTTADGRPNHPLRSPSPVPTSPAELTLQPWTHAELQRQREAFFDTRVTGSSESWAALKIICDMLRSGDVASAQGLLDASGLTCPTGRVVGARHSSRSGRVKKGGVYDDKGVLYDVPGWIVADPEDLVEEEAFMDEKSGGAGEGFGAAGALEEKSDVDVGEIVKVKARLSGMEKDVTVSIGMEQKIGVLVSKIKEKTGAKSVRLAHLGKMLKESQTLSETGWAPGHVFNAFVFE